MRVAAWSAITLALLSGCASSPHFATRSDFQLATPQVSADPSGRIFTDAVAVTLTLDCEGTTIHYTLDGTKPSMQSRRYDAPLLIRESATLQAIAVGNGFRESDVVRREFRKRGSQAASAEISPAAVPPYAGDGASTLIDGLAGSDDFRDGAWLGYQSAFFVTLDCGSPQTIDVVTIGCRQDPGSWIFFPGHVRVETSLDGARFQAWPETDTVPPAGDVSRLGFISCHGPATSARWVRIEIRPRAELPADHAGYPDGRPWVFVDEVIIGRE